VDAKNGGFLSRFHANDKPCVRLIFRVDLGLPVIGGGALQSVRFALIQLGLREFLDELH
jgi:hypothetical protein